MKRDLEFAVPRPLAIDWWRARPLHAVALAVALIVLAFWQTAQSIVAIWARSDTFAHGFFVVPLCMWVAWRKRDELVATAARPWWWGLILVFAAGALWLVASAAGAGVVGQFALLFMLQAAIVTIVGLRVSRVLAFPLLFMLFAVPAGEFLVPTLMDWTADFTVAALRWSGVPVYREANFFVIPTGSWSVIEACSGIRYIIASLMVGTIYAAISYHSVFRRSLFIGASILVPIVANWVRAYMIVMLGHLSNNKIATGVDHIIYGWIFFGIVMLLLFWIGSFWQESDRPGSVAERVVLHRNEVASSPQPRSYVFAALAAVAMASMWLPVDAAVNKRIANGDVLLPAVAGSSDWIPADRQIADWKPQYAGYAADSVQTYAKDARRVGLYIAFYRHQQKGSELITSGNVLTRPIDWNWKQTASGTAAVVWAGRPITVGQAELSGRDSRLNVFRLFWIAGQTTSDPYVAKALQAVAKLQGRGDDAALIVMYAPIMTSREDADRSLRSFAADMSPAIEQSLADASKSGR